mmetsp:Transcript_3410/g.9276  ORF Transcript_3410/g.9276 Transcript_3410/m.9276 type:complete len:91 (+) Transcript_3410:842-1114(+)
MEDFGTLPRTIINNTLPNLDRVPIVRHNLKEWHCRITRNGAPSQKDPSSEKSTDPPCRTPFGKSMLLGEVARWFKNQMNPLPRDLFKIII